MHRNKNASEGRPSAKYKPYTYIKCCINNLKKTVFKKKYLYITSNPVYWGIDIWFSCVEGVLHIVKILGLMR